MINKPLKELLDMHPAFEKVKTFLPSLSTLTPSGRYEIDGDNIFAIVSRYITKREQEVFVEAHREHSEIHLLLKGRECLGYLDVSPLELYASYDAEKDIVFYHRPGVFERAFIDVDTAVFFNCGEGHAPCIACSEPQENIKVVIKFRKRLIESL